MDRSRPIILSADLSELTGGGAEGRRERAATALERGLDFVDAQGSELSKLRARVILKLREPADGVDALATRQAGDGSFAVGADRCFPSLPPGAEGVGLDEGPLSGTLEALAVFGSLRGLHAQPVDAAVGFLAQSQQGDGSWRLDGAGRGDRDLFTTGMVGGFLGRTRCVRPEVLDAAGRFVESEWAPERVEGGSWAAIAAFAHFFTNVHHDLADEALQWCGRELERGFRKRDFDSIATLRVLQYCDADALPGLRIETEELLDLLLAEQSEDGGFHTACLGAVSAERSRIAVTLESMRSLLALCAALSD